YIALIVANCAVLGRAEAFAAKNPVLPSGMDGLMMGLGFTFALTTIGAVREILGTGTLFTGAHLLLGPSFSFMEMKLIPEYKGFLLMILPPGGFLAVGFLIAAKRIIDRHRAPVSESVPVAAPAVG
ncbi:MAG: Rnf-Nqr domain containing protein, partial [Gallionella sp.]